MRINLALFLLGQLTAKEFKCTPVADLSCFDKCYRSHRTCSAHALVTMRPAHFELCTIKFLGCYEPCTNESAEVDTTKISCFHTLWTCQSECSNEAQCLKKCTRANIACMSKYEEENDWIINWIYFYFILYVQLNGLCSAKSAKYVSNGANNFSSLAEEVGLRWRRMVRPFVSASFEHVLSSGVRLRQ